ncbi:MAG: alpha/beta fold hydrolase [Gemmobacter sp.]
MFEGFVRRRVDTGEVSIACVEGGDGPAVLLLHGYPQNLAEWAHVAPRLVAAGFTVVCADLRGYGDSDKPPAAHDHATYSFRAMAADQVRLMAALGHERFHVAGHDRGARTAHRLALDWPDRATSLAVLDIVPTWEMYANVTKRLAQTYWQWYFLPQKAPLPERLIGADPDFFYESCLASVGGIGLADFDPALLTEYRRCWRAPEAIHAWCSDYRAGASIDLEHDRADLGRVLDMPVLALWGGDGIMQTLFDIEALWRPRARVLRTATAPGGHWFPEQAPAETAAALIDHFRAA